MAQCHTAGHLSPALPGHESDLHQSALIPIPWDPTALALLTLESGGCTDPMGDHEVMGAWLVPFIPTDSPKAGTLHLFMTVLCKGALLHHRAASTALLCI